MTPHPFSPTDPNLERLQAAAACLSPELRERFVFVGGAVAGLLVTDPGMPPVRTTEDVDAVVEVLATHDYHRIEQTLRELGFTPDMRPQAPICRWCKGTVVLDVMPTSGNVLGFTNRWYTLATTCASRLQLPNGLAVRVIQAPVFLGTKLEAFHGRGNGDFLFSHDLGDALALIDGRHNLLAECHSADAALRHYLANQFTALLAQNSFLEALACHLPGDAASQERLPDLLEKLRQLGQLETAKASNAPAAPAAPAA